MKAQFAVASQSLHHLGWGRVATLLCLLLLWSGLPLQALTLTAEEQKIANSLVSNSGQRRDRSQMRPDDRLIQVARARAMDMAKRRYFAHVNPDGLAANALVRATGYQLPASWSAAPKTNYIESIGAGYTSGGEAWSAWMGSSGHKTHLLATDSFYRDQVSYGVGHYYDPSSPYRHYWVVITAPPSPVMTLSLASPLTGARVTTQNVAVTGSVSGNAIFSALQVRLDTPGATGDWSPVPLHSGSGVAKWTANVAGLKPGVNTLRVRTLNTSGGVAREMTRSVRMVVVKPLTVSVDGEGTVTAGFLGTTQREIGVPFTVGALPKKGFILSHWTGLPVGLDTFRATQTVAMAENLSLTAHFVADPYPALAAAYTGVFADTSPVHQSSGAINAKVTSGGAFTGAVFFSGQRYGLRGRFNSQGDATVTVPRVGKTPLTFVLHIDPTGLDQRITGTVSDGTSTVALDAAKAPASTTPAQYNVHLAPSGDAATPQGHGYLVLTQTANGQVRIAGRLADGSVITAGTTLAGNTAPIYLPLYGRLGSLAGQVTFNGSTAQGSLVWHQPARRGTRFAQAFDTTHAVAGSLYTPTTGTGTALNFTNGSLEVDSPELSAILTLPFGLAPGSRVTYPAVPPVGWRLAVNGRTGRFVGSYVHPASGVKAFSGVIDQAANTAYGFALGPTQSAAVTLVE